MAGGGAIIAVMFLFLLLIGAAIYGYMNPTIFQTVGATCVPTSLQTDLNGLTYVLNSNKICSVSSCNTGYTLSSSGVCIAAGTSEGTSTTTTTSGGTTTSETSKPTFSPVLGTTPGSSCIPYPARNAATSNVLSYNRDNDLKCVVGQCSTPQYSVSKTDLLACVLSSSPASSGSSGSVQPVTSTRSSSAACYNQLGTDSGSCLQRGRGGMAGISWKWTDPTGECKSKICAYYMISVYSSKNSTVIYTMKLKGGQNLSAAISGLWAHFYEGQIYFTVMPYDKNDAKLADDPIMFDGITQANTTKTCASLGITPYEAVPHWNENKNLIRARLHNSVQGNQSGWSVWDAQGKIIEDVGDTVLGPPGGLGLAIWSAGVSTGGNWTKTGYTYVPEGGGINLLCDGHIAGWQSWNNDNSWDHMIKQGADKAGYKYYMSLGCISGDAKDDYEFRPDP